MRKYRNIKGNPQPKRILKYSEEWIEYRKKRGADSVKVEHCDIDTDGFHDAIVRDWRSPALKKQQICSTSSGEAPNLETEYLLVLFNDAADDNQGQESDGRWWPNNIDNRAILMGDVNTARYYALPLDGEPITIQPEMDAYYTSNITQGEGVGDNLWQWFWNRYLINFEQPYTIAASGVQYSDPGDSDTVGLYMTDINPYTLTFKNLESFSSDRFDASSILQIMETIQTEGSTGLTTGSGISFQPNYDEIFTTAVGGGGTPPAGTPN